MTDKKTLKVQARQLAADTGMPYAAALRRVLTDGPARLFGASVHAALADALRDAGWPVTVHGFSEHAWRLTAGPSVGIDVRPSDGDTDGVLEVESLHALTDTADARGEDVVEMTARFPDCAGPDYEFLLDPGLPASRQVRVVERVVSSSRARAVTAAVNDAECDYCRDPYPFEHLLAMTADADGPRDLLCPGCAFEPNVVDGRNPAAFAEAYDALMRVQAAAPAGWGGVAVFTAVALKAGGFDVAAELERDPFSGLEPHWSDPTQVWVWLPPVPVRPECWKDVGPGATIGRLVSLLDRDDPGLGLRLQHARDGGAVSGDVTYLSRPRFIEELWPAAVAYAVAFTTQQYERPRLRSPWQHVMSGSLNQARTGDYVEGAGIGSWDWRDVQATLELSVGVARELFGLDVRTA